MRIDATFKSKSSARGCINALVAEILGMPVIEAFTHQDFIDTYTGPARYSGYFSVQVPRDVVQGIVTEHGGTMTNHELWPKAATS